MANNDELKVRKFSSHDFSGCMLSTIAAAKKYGVNYYVYTIYGRGWTSSHRYKPPSPQSYIRVEPNGKIYEVKPHNGEHELFYAIQ